MTSVPGSAPALAATRSELTTLLADARSGGARVAFVPTMGALHAGHAGLMEEARRRVGPEGRVVVSVFVNPLQFGPHEDLDRYPRTLPADLEVCGAVGVDVVFAPAVEEVYPRGVPWEAGSEVTVEPGALATVLEGRTRPGHFRGVLTVVAKLFGLVRPDLAVFGQKDYQQLVLIRRMVADLCLPIEIVGAETHREADGLALSSRNRFLSDDERLRARALSRSLFAAQEAASWGPAVALDAARAELRAAEGVDLDYLEITDVDLGPLPDDVAAGTEGRVLIAAKVGTTRLIDNLPLVFGSAEAAAPPATATTPTTPGAR